jgi:CO/xanthine dehydrogenase Mo-binding subunit
MSHAYGPLPRKEDARFIRGQGKFIDDLTLPGMPHKLGTDPAELRMRNLLRLEQFPYTTHVGV